MFDVSFSELLIIAVVALLVIGPEKLPKVARTVGAFTGRMQRFMAQVKEEVNREVRFDELQKLQQEIKQSAENLQSNINQEVVEIQTTVSDTTKPKQQKIAKKPTQTPVKKRVKAAKPRLDDTN
jgi:sec-independent protein translocase protein TatB